jgi:hypothetical protein
MGAHQTAYSPRAIRRAIVACQYHEVDPAIPADPSSDAMVALQQQHGRPIRLDRGYVQWMGWRGQRVDVS